jgi:hypothetical protein
MRHDCRPAYLCFGLFASVLVWCGTYATAGCAGTPAPTTTSQTHSRRSVPSLHFVDLATLASPPDLATELNLTPSAEASATARESGSTAEQSTDDERTGHSLSEVRDVVLSPRSDLPRDVRVAATSLARDQAIRLFNVGVQLQQLESRLRNISAQLAAFCRILRHEGESRNISEWVEMANDGESSIREQVEMAAKLSWIEGTVKTYAAVSTDEVVLKDYADTYATFLSQMTEGVNRLEQHLVGLRSHEAFITAPPRKMHHVEINCGFWGPYHGEVDCPADEQHGECYCDQALGWGRAHCSCKEGPVVPPEPPSPDSTCSVPPRTGGCWNAGLASFSDPGCHVTCAPGYRPTCREFLCEGNTWTQSICFCSR